MSMKTLQGHRECHDYKLINVKNVVYRHANGKIEQPKQMYQNWDHGLYGSTSCCISQWPK